MFSIRGSEEGTFESGQLEGSEYNWRKISAFHTSRWKNIFSTRCIWSIWRLIATMVAIILCLERDENGCSEFFELCNLLIWKFDVNIFFYSECCWFVIERRLLSCLAIIFPFNDKPLLFLGKMHSNRVFFQPLGCRGLIALYSERRTHYCFE